MVCWFAEPPKAKQENKRRKTKSGGQKKSKCWEGVWSEVWGVLCTCY